MKPTQEEKVIELLQDGNAIPWPRLPDKTCGFDYWHIVAVPSPTTTMLGNINMVRHA